MVKKKHGHSAIWEKDSKEEQGLPGWTMPPPACNLGLLGDSVRRLHPRLWQCGMFFHGARDTALRELTGSFPATLRTDKTTHPIYILRELPGLGHKVCPCSSKNWGAARFVRKGCVLEYTGRIMDKSSYLVESLTFNLPLDPEFTDHLIFMGRVPSSCMECCSS